jgi:transcriptional regulator GlxA family with amidase domain
MAAFSDTTLFQPQECQVQRSIGFVVFPGFQMMALAPLPVFECANDYAPRYDVRVLSEKGGLVRSSSGLSVDTEALGDPSFDTLIICSSSRVDLLPTAPAFLSLIRESAKVSRRVASICLGAFVLASAGLLDGRRATTHWALAREFRARFPKVSMDDDRIFVVDGNIWTSAGMTAGVDLALAMVEEDMGAEAARSIAKTLVVYHRRTGGQLQYSALLELEPKSDRIQSALAFAKRNLSKPISVEQLADIASLSLRHFGRAFQSETGYSPAKAIEKLRVEAARLMLEEGRHSIETIASETGFADRERMRRAFVRAFGQSPQAFRRNARVDIAA